MIVGVLLVTAGAIAFEVIRLSRQQPQNLDDDGGSGPVIENCLKDDPPVVSGPPGFVDITDEVGLDFVHTVGPLGTYYMPESIGAGGAFFDYDGDGILDVYLLNCGRSPEAVGDFAPGTRLENRLFRGTAAGVFEDVTAESGLGDLGYAAGCAIGDIDNDGHPDVYITNYGPDCCYHNNGNGTFSDVSASTGLNNPDWGTCAAFFDYDRDGWLDLVVVNYTADPVYGHSVGCGTYQGTVSYCGPHKFKPTIDRLYHNDGPQPDADGAMSVRFSDVTRDSGLDSADTFGFGVACADFTRDGWPDMFIANDGAPNRLWVNQRDGTFREEGLVRGAAYNAIGVAEAGMGVAMGDVNQDGAIDLAVTHLTNEKTTLYLSVDGDSFTDMSTQVGIEAPTQRHTGWGTALIDLNHDGYLDLPQVNGLVIPCHSGFPFHGEDAYMVRHDQIDDADAYWKEYIDLNVLLMGKEDGQFVDASETAGDFRMAVGSARALLHADVDSDGDLDVLVTNCGSQARLYRNDFAKQGHWLLVETYDPANNRDAYGAEIQVVCGDRRFHAICQPSSSYLASHDPRVHFGLGDSMTCDEIIVRWPDGDPETVFERFPGGPVDRRITLRRGEGRAIEESEAHDRSVE